MTIQNSDQKNPSLHEKRRGFHATPSSLISSHAFAIIPYRNSGKIGAALCPVYASTGTAVMSAVASLTLSVKPFAIFSR